MARKAPGPVQREAIPFRLVFPREGRLVGSVPSPCRGPVGLAPRGDAKTAGGAIEQCCPGLAEGQSAAEYSSAGFGGDGTHDGCCAVAGIAATMRLFVYAMKKRDRTRRSSCNTNISTVKDVMACVLRGKIGRWTGKCVRGRASLKLGEEQPTPLTVPGRTRSL